MADSNDVTTALAAFVDAAIYPSGDSGASATGYATIIRPGWPLPDNLDAALAAAQVYVSVYPEEISRITTRFERLWTSSVVVTPTITITAAKQLITIGGTVTVGHYVSAVIFNKAASYAAQAGDTLASVATALAALLTTAGVSATATGAVISIPTADLPDIAVANGAPGTMIQEVRRQQQSFMVTIWAPSNDARAATANIIDPLLASTDYIGPFPDTTQGWLLFRLERESDEGEKRACFRRDLCYWVEYPTTISAPAYPITVFASSINVADGTTNGATFVENAG